MCQQSAFERHEGYESSQPARDMLAIVVECLLATHMSRKPLISGYGFPCPALPPGIAGARNVKWVSAKGGQWGGTRSPSQRLSFPTRCGY